MERSFSEGIAKAAECYRQAYVRHPEFPEAAAGMIGVAHTSAGGEADLRVWFRLALDAQPDYRPAYSAMFNFLLPRWAGVGPRSTRSAWPASRPSGTTPRCLGSTSPPCLTSAATCISNTWDRVRCGGVPEVYQHGCEVLDGYLAVSAESRGQRTTSRAAW